MSSQTKNLTVNNIIKVIKLWLLKYSKQTQRHGTGKNLSK